MKSCRVKVRVRVRVRVRRIKRLKGVNYRVKVRVIG